MCPDHYPWMTHTPPALPPAQPASRFVKRGEFMLCLACGLTSAYCRCASQPDTRDAERAAEDLARRVKECQGGT